MEDTKQPTAVIRSPISYSIAGTVGGLLGVTVGHPLDTIKVRLQTTDILAQSGTKYTGTFDCIARTVRAEGLLALFKGLTPHILVSVPMSSVMFWGYGMGLKLQSKDQDFDKLTPLNIFNAGIFSGLCTTLAIVPFYRVKCQLQVQQISGQNAKYKGPVSLALQIYRNTGLRGLYKGLCAELLTLPGTGCYYLSYEYMLKTLAPNNTARENIGSFRVLLAGGLAGTVWWLVALPADTITSRLWSAPEGAYPRGARDVLKQMLRHEGVLALYKGLVPVLLRAAPESAALFWGYELTLKAISWISGTLSPMPD